MAAEKICSLFLPITKQLKYYFVLTYFIYIHNCIHFFRESSIQDLEECLENIHNCLDDVWKIEEFKYPQSRMEHLLEVIGNSVIKLIQQNTSNMNIWAGEYSENIDVLNMCKRICSKWIRICEQLTLIYWPNYSYHKWNGPTYSPESLISYSNHIQEVGTL